MAAPKSKTGMRNGAGRRLAGESPKGTAGFKLQFPAAASKQFTSAPKQMKALLQVYGDAIARSRRAGRPVSFRVDVDPEGETVVTPVEDTTSGAEVVRESAAAPAGDLAAALAAARERGRLRAAEILSGEDMLNADAFAKMLGTTRVTVNTKRQNGQILGLDGTKRGFRFPAWQLDGEGKPYAELAALHDLLGSPWAIYRFLMQPHGELDGLTGREALERGKGDAVLAAAESVGRDFR